MQFLNHLDLFSSQNKICVETCGCVMFDTECTRFCRNKITNSAPEASGTAAGPSPTYSEPFWCYVDNASPETYVNKVSYEIPIQIPLSGAFYVSILEELALMKLSRIRIKHLGPASVRNKRTLPITTFWTWPTQLTYSTTIG